ncbi:MAG: ATP-binding protein [Treponema sp.]|jgi:predicted AAA+ superfamily ATPase|nr:ATP-binding protein [Treponema sp.]
MIPRPEYLKRLFGFKDKQLIKIVTGVRRCGKSTLLELYQAELAKRGVDSEQIQSINLEDPAYRNLPDWEKLYDYINTRLLPDRKNYIFIDEIQNVKDFQKAADGLFIKKNVDLYLTGSNSRMQSGEWATLLSGRYVEIHMFPLSFKEYADAFPYFGTADAMFAGYLEYGSFPYITSMMESNLKIIKSQVFDYLSGVYNTIVLKDVVENKRIKEVGRLERVIKFMSDNIGSETSIKKISDMLTADGIKILPLTVESYLDAFRDSYILYRADRYDVKGKKLLKTLNKYYLVDMGLRRFLLGDKPIDSGHVLENVVYLELLRRNHKVYVGKVGGKEVDFVTEGPDGTEYYQVSETVRGRETLARELFPLDAIRDHNPKFLLTRDYDPHVSHNGIKQLNVLDWLLS